LSNYEAHVRRQQRSPLLPPVMTTIFPSILLLMFLSLACQDGSATDQPLQMFWVARSLDRDLGDGAVDVAEIVCSQFDASRSDVFFQAMQLGGAGDRNDPRLLGQQPS
jgi:hypothetical protein